MQVQSFDGRHLLRLESGERVMSSLAHHFGRLHKSEEVSFANVNAAGAVSWARLAYWDAEEKAYRDRDFDEQLEVVSLQGNIALKDGEPFAHIHVVLAAADFSTIGGHLRDAVVRPTLEVWLRSEDVVVARRRDAKSGLDLLDIAGDDADGGMAEEGSKR